MAIAESRRLALFESAKTSWGEDTAQTLMDLLPPDPAALATKADIAVLDAGLRTEIAGVRPEIAGVRVEVAGRRSDLEAKISEQTRLLMITMLTTTVTIVLAIVLSS